MTDVMFRAAGRILFLLVARKPWDLVRLGQAAQAPPSGGGWTSDVAGIGITLADICTCQKGNRRANEVGQKTQMYP